MMGVTHKAIAITLGILTGFTLTIQSIIGFFIILITSTLPDIDYKIGLKHREITHSFLFLGLVTLIGYLVYKPSTYPIIIGYGSHLIADSFTKSGVPLLYPNKKMYGLKLIGTSSSWDWFICLICLGWIAHLMAK